MEIILGIIIGIIIGAGGSVVISQRMCKKRKCETSEGIGWKPVDERMEEVSSKKTRATHNKIADEITHTDKPKKKRYPRKNTGKKRYYKNKKKKATKSD